MIASDLVIDEFHPRGAILNQSTVTVIFYLFDTGRISNEEMEKYWLDDTGKYMPKLKPKFNGNG